MRSALIRLVACIGLGICIAGHAAPVRLKDLGKFAGWRDNALVGSGIVTGLAGTGDAPGNRMTRQALSNVLAQFDIAVQPEDVQSRNVAVVSVTARLPPVARPGDTLDVTVSALGDARSLAGGTLLLTPLKGPDNKVYALAQGALFVGGYKFDLNGNVAQKNHPTTGSIPAGATVEGNVRAPLLQADETMLFTLAEPDLTTAARIADAINGAFGQKIAHAVDAEGVQIAVPDNARGHLVDFATRIEKLGVEPDRRARVVVDERTGTVVSGGDVRIERVVVSHGDLKLSIVTEHSVSQPLVLGRGTDAVRTELVANSRVGVQEQGETGFVSTSGNTVADLIQALTRIRTPTRDIISILRAVKTAGALHADLVIQ